MDGEKQRVAITGASGLVGTALTRHLEGSGYRVLRLVRRQARSDDEVAWSPEEGTVQSERLEGITALVHLAGENLAQGRWTPELKQRIRDSRVNGTRTMARAIAGLQQPPKAWVSASAIGYYGDSGAQTLTEASPPGTEFLSQLCAEWEAETAPAKEVTRVVNARLGVVLTEQGGALSKMLPFFRLGLGGKVGNGQQYLSWIELSDVCRAITFCIEQDGIAGPVNVVGPNPVTNVEFTRALGKVLHRPTVLPVPSFAVRLRFGEFATEALSSQRVIPERLTEAGFRFQYSEVSDALAVALAA